MKIKLVSKFNEEKRRQETTIVNADTNELIEGVTHVHIEIGVDGPPIAILEVINPVIHYIGKAKIKKQILTVERECNSEDSEDYDRE